MADLFESTIGVRLVDRELTRSPARPTESFSSLWCCGFGCNLCGMRVQIFPNFSFGDARAKKTVVVVGKWGMPTPLRVGVKSST